MKFISFIITIFGIINALTVIPTLNSNISRITFGSCNKYVPDQKSDIFHQIKDRQSDVFAFLGDTAYIDYPYYSFSPLFWTPETNLTRIRQKFDLSKKDPAYQSLIHSQTKVVGIFDDHHSNMNDGDKTNPYKNIMIKEFLTFIDEPQGTPRWTNPNGIYTSYYIGDQKRIKLILLDARSSRDVQNDKAEDILGETQWNWLTQELNDQVPLMFILASGYQIMPDDRLLTEYWYPYSKEKLYKIIQKSDKKVIFMSGDVHYAEIMKHPCGISKYGLNLIEITSSGLTFSETNYQTQIPFFNDLKNMLIPNTFNRPDNRYFEMNFGEIQVDWNEEEIQKSVIKLKIFAFNNSQPVLSHQLYLQQLSVQLDKINEYTGSNQCKIQKGNKWDRIVNQIIFGFFKCSLKFQLLISGIIIGSLVLMKQTLIIFLRSFKKRRARKIKND